MGGGHSRDRSRQRVQGHDPHPDRDLRHRRDDLESPASDVRRLGDASRHGGHLHERFARALHDCEAPCRRDRRVPHRQLLSRGREDLDQRRHAVVLGRARSDDADHGAVRSDHSGLGLAPEEVVLRREQGRRRDLIASIEE